MSTQARFPAASRLLHWLMAPMIVAMLFIGVGMAASVSARYELLVSIHRPLGIAVFVLCLARIVNRFINPPPELLDTVPSPQRFTAKASHIVLYGTLCAHVHHAAGRLGHAVGGALSDRALWAAAVATDPAA
jgi:cytochrome b561